MDAVLRIVVVLTSVISIMGDALAQNMGSVEENPITTVRTRKDRALSVKELVDIGKPWSRGRVIFVQEEEWLAVPNRKSVRRYSASWAERSVSAETIDISAGMGERRAIKRYWSEKDKIMVGEEAGADGTRTTTLRKYDVINVPRGYSGQVIWEGVYCETAGFYFPRRMGDAAQAGTCISYLEILHAVGSVVSRREEDGRVHLDVRVVGGRENAAWRAACLSSDWRGGESSRLVALSLDERYSYGITSREEYDEAGNILVSVKCEDWSRFGDRWFPKRATVAYFVRLYSDDPPSRSPVMRHTARVEEIAEVPGRIDWTEYYDREGVWVVDEREEAKKFFPSGLAYIKPASEKTLKAAVDLAKKHALYGGWRIVLIGVLSIVTLTFIVTIWRYEK